DEVLDDFCRKFVDRYGDREVPLLEALDPEQGIALSVTDGSRRWLPPLLDGLKVPLPQRSRYADFGRRETTLLKMLERAWAAGEHEIRLPPSDAEALEEAPEAALPDAFAAVATLVAPSADSVSGGAHRILLSSAFGPSGMLLAGRFCDVDDELAELVR